MAINGSRFMGGGGASARTPIGSARFMTPRDSTNLVKTVNAINKNLISINKMLQQQYTTSTQTKLQQQRTRNIEAENLRRESAESGLETAKKIGGFVNASLIRPSKKIITTIFSLAQGFIKFFALSFVGWFTKNIVTWFEQSKATRDEQLKTWAAKIGTALTVAASVLIAIKIGVPVLIGLMSTVVSVVITSLSALLNPFTWKALLVGGLAILGGELLFRGIDALAPDVKAQRRTESILKRGFVKELEATLSDSSLRKVRKIDEDGNLVDAEMITLNPGQYIKTEQITRLLNENPVDRRFELYEDVNGVIKQTDPNATITKQQLEKAEVFYRDTALRDLLIRSMDRRDFTVALGEAYKARQGYETYLKGYNQQKASRGTSPQLEQERARKEQEYKKILTKAQSLYDKLSPTNKAELSSAGITRDKLVTAEVFEQSPGEFLFGSIKADVLNSGFVRDIKSAKDGLMSQLSTLSREMQDFLQINVNNVLSDPTGEDNLSAGEIGAPGSISPIDFNNPFITEAGKYYQLVAI